MKAAVIDEQHHLDIVDVPDPDPLPPGTALMNEATVRWVMYHTRGEFELAARLLERGDIDGDAFVTGHTALDGIDAAFRELKGQSAHRKLVMP